MPFEMAHSLVADFERSLFSLVKEIVPLLSIEQDFLLPLTSFNFFNLIMV